MDLNDIVLADLNGFLEAFAWVNAKCDHVYTFDVTWLEKPQGLQAALEKHFTGAASAVDVERLSDWRVELAVALPRWLFAYLFDPLGQLADPSRRFSLSSETFRQQLTSIVLDKISKVMEVERAWRVQITEIGFYECSWEDYAFESRDHVMLLHLGVSD